MEDAYWTEVRLEDPEAYARKVEMEEKQRKEEKAKKKAEKKAGLEDKVARGKQDLKR